MSGGYEDDVDNSEDVVYTGQGGNDLLSTKKQIKDQKMEKGNLALKVRFFYPTYLRCIIDGLCMWRELIVDFSSNQFAMISFDVPVRVFFIQFFTVRLIQVT